MESVESYRQLLGLTAPWTVKRAELDMARQQAAVHMGHLAGHRFLAYLHTRLPHMFVQHGMRQMTLPWVTKFWKCWYFWVTHRRLVPMVEVVKLIARHLQRWKSFQEHAPNPGGTKWASR
ncbi:MAG: hypothetical protein KGK17_09815 [Betaproteobacteria bacterium]|nr:hypothetical protein [Betaproteobacteria bacterium]